MTELQQWELYILSESPIEQQDIPEQLHFNFE